VRTAGLVLIASGATLIYWVLRAGLKKEVASSPSSSSSSSPLDAVRQLLGIGSSNSSLTMGANQPVDDSGTHIAVDTTGTETGTVGQVYTVNATYGDSTPQQQDDMNAYAHAIGNVMGG
jgi:hypothetical protein